MPSEDVNLDPDEASEGGGGLLQAVSNAGLTIRATAYDYGGSVAVPVPAIHVHGEYEDEDGEDQEFDEYYSMGDASKFRAKKDGSGFVALQEGARPTKTCKGMQFLASLVSANGGEKDGITNVPLTDLDGINVDMERKPDIDRPGLEARKDGRKRTIMLVTEINALPGETKKKKSGTKASAKKGKAAKAPAKKGGASAKALKAKTIEKVSEAILANGGELEVDDLPQLVFRKNKKDPDVKAMTELASDEDFLTDDDTPWGLDDGTLTLEEEEE